MTMKIDNLDVEGALTGNTVNSASTSLDSHGTRHNPGGSDPISTAAPVAQTPDQTNTEGAATSVARSNHVHNIPTATAVSIKSNVNAQGAASSFANSAHTHEVIASAVQDSVPQFDGSNLIATLPEDLFPRNRIISLFDDWISGSGAGNLGWTQNVVGGGSTDGIVDASANNAPGVLFTRAGGAAARTSTRHLGLNTFILGGGQLAFEYRVQVPILSTAAQEFFGRWGMGDIAGLDHVNGFYFEYNRLTSANWLIKTANASTRTTTITSIPLSAATYYRIRAVVNAAGTSIEYFINDVSVGTITTNIPTLAIGPVISSERSAGGTVRDIYTDFFKLKQRFTTPR